MQNEPPPQLERLPSVLRRTGLGRSSVYVAIGEGTFPRPVKISPRAIGFLTCEIDAWIEQRVADRDTSHETRPDQPGTQVATGKKYLPRWDS